MYRVLVNGQNFLVDFDGTIAKHGFFVTRFVDAINDESAEVTAISALKNDAYLRSITKNHSDDPPLLFVDELEDIRDKASQPKTLAWLGTTNAEAQSSSLVQPP